MCAGVESFLFCYSFDFTMSGIGQRCLSSDDYISRVIQFSERNENEKLLLSNFHKNSIKLGAGLGGEVLYAKQDDV